MKYLHSGYILFCDRASHEEDGRLNCSGLFDLASGKQLPVRMKCSCVVGFGTPYERRQYHGKLTIEDPNGVELASHEFNANDPNDLFKGHYIQDIDLDLKEQGCYTARVILSNWKSESVWEVSRQFWAMVVGDAPPDP